MYHLKQGNFHISFAWLISGELMTIPLVCHPLRGRDREISRLFREWETSGIVISLPEISQAKDMKVALFLTK